VHHDTTPQHVHHPRSRELCSSFTSAYSLVFEVFSCCVALLILFFSFPFWDTCFFYILSPQLLVTSFIYPHLPTPPSLLFFVSDSLLLLLLSDYKTPHVPRIRFPRTYTAPPVLISFAPPRRAHDRLVLLYPL